MRRQIFSGWRSFTLRLASVALIGSLLYAPAAEAATQAVSGTTPIRVGLMLKAGSLNTTTDTVTLQGREGLQTGFYIDGTFKPLYTAAGAVRVSLDNYFIVIGEHDALDKALTQLFQAEGQEFPADLHIEQVGDKKIYQVVHGFFETKAQADQALTKVKSAYQGAVLKGYNRLTTGKLPDRQTALAKVTELRAAGFEAYLLLRRDGSQEVWVGNEATPAALEDLRTRVKTKTGAALVNADYLPADYLLMKTGYWDGKEVPHFLQNSTIEESAFVPQGNPAVTKVFEKGNREYRGTILVQGYNEKPNVINYVPLDQYLYGVLPQEMATGWPLEALKAQAVAARTYAVKRLGGKKWGVADLMDDVWDQAYRGYSREAADTNQAVDETKGQVLTKDGQMIEALYSSNNGGKNGDVREIWKSQGITYLTAVDGPFDHVAAEKEPICYRVQLPNGQIGWLRETNIVKTGQKNSSGFEYARVTQDQEPLRAVPDFYAKEIGKVAANTNVIILEQDKEYNTYNWQRGPYSPTDIMNMINTNQANGYPTVGRPVYDLRVSQWIQGDRVGEITADGVAITVRNPDYYRYLFNDMWSTRMTIEQQGTYTVLGANGQTSEYPNAKLQGRNLHVISASQQTPTKEINGSNNSFVLLGANGKSRIVTKEQSYVLHGYGWGHGLGMSQWGAHGMAKNGYTYDQILLHYYQGVTLTPKQ